MMDWIQVVWNKRHRALLRKQGMFVLDSFKGHLMLEVISVILGVTEPGGMTSPFRE
jgi:hypothetical protein